MRRFVIVACATLMCGALNMGVASATMTPATGTLSCGANGTMTLKPGIPGNTQAPTAKWTMGKVHTATLDTCNSSGVTGGKATITGGVVIVNAKFATGASCDTLMTSLTSVAKAILGVKLTNTTVDPLTLATTTRTVAVVRPTNLVVTSSGNGLHVTGTLPQTPAGNKPFGGEVFEAQVNIDNTSDVSACTTGPTPLDHIDFSTAGGSSISIHP